MNILDIKEFGRVGVVRGGPSSEHGISLGSGRAVLDTITEIIPEVVDFKIPKQEYKNEKDLENCISTFLKQFEIDTVFIALHGYFGEDGKIQKILERLGLPYTGSGQKASRLAMDKIASREIFFKNNIFVPKYRILTKKNNKIPDVQLPIVVKPYNLGSSVGLNIAYTYLQLEEAIVEAFDLTEKIILEEYIDGREITVGILNEKVLPPIEIIPKIDKFYNFNAKYANGATEYIAPAELSVQLIDTIKKFAWKAYCSLGCRGCARVDMMLSKECTPFVLEINTIPGLTKTSLIPKAAKQIGIDFKNLILTMLSSAVAFKRNDNEKKT